MNRMKHENIHKPKKGGKKIVLPSHTTVCSTLAYIQENSPFFTLQNNLIFPYMTTLDELIREIDVLGP